MGLIQSRKKNFLNFSTTILGLGNVRTDANVINALSAIFDLEGFTEFCSQIDPQLAIPEYLDKFLNWLFRAIEDAFTHSTHKNTITIWGSLPFFGKFTGDGALFLWDTDLSRGQTGIGNIAVALKEICAKYSREFYPVICKDIAKVPKKLRVGIARGQVLSIGGDSDYVGPCINMSSRLQKLAQLSYVISRRGFDPRASFSKEWQKEILIRRINVRGIGQNEPVIILKKEYQAMSKEDKKLFV